MLSKRVIAIARGRAVLSRSAGISPVALSRGWEYAAPHTRRAKFHTTNLLQAETVKVPQMAESISEGTLKSWSKKIGEAVEADEEVATIETDKIDVSVNAPAAGKITEFLANEEDTVTVGQDLFRFEPGAAGEAAPSAPTPSPPSPEAEVSKEGRVKAATEPKEQPVEKKAPPPPTPSGAPKGGVPTEGQKKELKKPSKPAKEEKVPAPAPVAGSRNETRVKMNRMRLRIAERLKESQNTAASLTTFNEIDMSSLMEMRKKYKEEILKEHDVKLGFMSAFAKASCLALKEFPAANASIEGEEIIYREYVDLSVAVATPKGLVTPVLRNAESMSFVEIERAIAGLGKKARDGKLTLEDMAGGSFTISNGGVFGSLYGTPIINVPQAAVLGMHAIKERPVVVNGQIVIRPIMVIALTYDHRLLDGREAVTFLVNIFRTLRILEGNNVKRGSRLDLVLALSGLLPLPLLGSSQLNATGDPAGIDSPVSTEKIARLRIEGCARMSTFARSVGGFAPGRSGAALGWSETFDARTRQDQRFPDNYRLGRVLQVFVLPTDICSDATRVRAAHYYKGLLMDPVETDSRQRRPRGGMNVGKGSQGTGRENVLWASCAGQLSAGFSATMAGRNTLSVPCLFRKSSKPVVPIADRPAHFTPLLYPVRSPSSPPLPFLSQHFCTVVPDYFAMIMVQKPVHLLSSPVSHRRHPSAPPAVLVQSTRTPGLLSLSKPPQSTPPRSHQYQTQQRIPRPAPKAKSGNNHPNSHLPDPTHAQAQPVEDPKKVVSLKESTKFKSDGPRTSPSQPEKRGRQNGKPAKEKPIHRSTSHSSIRTPQPRRQPHHQGSPPLHSQIPSQVEAYTSPSKRASQSHYLRSRNPNANSFDPFVVNSASDSDSEPARNASSDSAPKAQVVRAPKLTPRPSGKLARRRQPQPEAPGTPTPPSSKAVPVPRGKAQARGREAGSIHLSRSDPVLSSISARPNLKPFAVSAAAWDAFPICDDLTDGEEEVLSTPSTPTREKRSSATTWQQSLVFDDGPRTAPLLSAYGSYPFRSSHSSPTPSTPTPDRKRHHQRHPSESVFNLSMDEDSSSDASEELKALVGLLPRKRLDFTPAAFTQSARKDERPGFFASSNFQNSPSPDDLPPPNF
ncbi:hypothetical protein EW146_g1851 [Bondarzewia mesenterica]|uniref:dihydrolipoyllysine-residue succinyltransferase n=1 Tax=Bondarzewia mesenterica TaxID=1095465 RepID=A0A4S4M4D7_9AGAM|nr:hypothetical protein EW146_g1851 [Bondarzewia mesenterica]